MGQCQGELRDPAARLFTAQVPFAAVRSLLWYQVDDVYSVCVKQEFLLPTSSECAKRDSLVMAKLFEILLWKMSYKRSPAAVGVCQL